MTAERKSILQAALIAGVAYWFCLRFLFPGYFDPLFPPHPDLCIPAGIQIRPLAEIFTYPRPVSFLFLRSFGWLGVHGSILIAIVTIGAGLLCLIWLVQIWTNRSASPWAIACYCVILFAQPQFYFQHRQDLASTQSFITCLLAIEFWRRWVSDHKGWHYFAFACCLALTVLTKETYIGSLAVLLLGVLFTLEKPSRKLVSIGLAGSLLVVAACEAINWRGYKEWVLPLLGQNTTYRASVDLRLIAKTAVVFLSKSVTWPALLILVLALGLLWRERRVLIVAISLMIAGVAALLPNSLLPNHVVSLYAWNAVPLLFAPLLVLPRRWTMMAPLGALICLWLWTNQAEYRSTGEQWAVKQEMINERVLGSFPQVKLSDAGAYRLLVTGLNAPLSPWGYEDFVRGALGDHRWVILVPADSVDRAGKFVSAKHVSEVNPANYNGAVEYRPDGSLLRVLTGQRYANYAKAMPEQILIPELGDVMPTVGTPGDFSGLLRVGTTLLAWGDPDRAQTYLEQAVRASNGANPYPFFFLGQCSEQKHDRTAALGFYEKAVAADREPRNPLFRQAVNRTSARP
jgi:hypothetical protein